MADSDILAGVGRTAIGVAWIRAEESRRPDRLFHDPYAAAFVDAARDASAAERTAASRRLATLGGKFLHHGAIRTRFFDEYLLASCAAGCRQVVLLAAGMDTRAFRLTWPDGVRLFELDLPEVLAFKERVLAERTASPRCARSALAADLREDWPAIVTAAGFDPALPTVWLAEGLLIYLSATDAARLLTTIGELSAAGSRLSYERADTCGSELLDQAREMPTMAALTELWKGGLEEDSAEWLGRNGWRTETRDHAALAAAYGRPGPAADGDFVIAER